VYAQDLSTANIPYIIVANADYEPPSWCAVFGVGSAVRMHLSSRQSKGGNVAFWSFAQLSLIHVRGWRVNRLCLNGRTSPKIVAALPFRSFRPRQTGRIQSGRQSNGLSWPRHALLPGRLDSAEAL
jgi:hypothetical protein